MTITKTFMMSGIIKGTVVVALLLGLVHAEDWTICQAGCKCKWVSGKKSADCEKGNFLSIPNGLSNEIQSLDLSENKLDRLPSEAFKSVGLENLHKIYLRACQIKELDRDTFKGLGILVEVDLSENKIHILHPGTFRDNIRLRLFSINKNPIKKIDANLFNNLFHLQNVEYTDCMLTEIDDKAFHNVTNLLHLKLNGNQLVYVKTSTFMELIKLRSLVLHDNPWECDCHLRDFRNWVIKKNLYSIPTSCSLPEHLRNKLWNIIKPEDFACKPQILWPSNGMSIVVDSKNVNMGCRVSGNPMPEVHWVHNSRIISDNTKVKYNVNRYAIKTSILNEANPTDRWVNLTINQVGLQDKGQFRCVARSPGGIDEKNVTLVVYADSDGFIGYGGSSESIPLIIGLSTGMTALFIVTSILCCCICCRNRQPLAKKSSLNNLPSNGDVLHHISQSNEQEKSLLRVNPIQKPPRRYEAQISSSNNDAVEQAELNRNLLDESTAQGNVSPGEDEQPVECSDVRQEHQENQPSSDARPPDLLAFPPKSQSVAPAANSKSSNCEIQSRGSLYPIVHQTTPSLSVQKSSAALPYSKSQSPFSPSPSAGLPRQGYVTIPRRPRAPSWSSTPSPSPSLLDDPLTSPVKTEAVYDNLGPRTTADGSSVIALNKPFPDTPRGRNVGNALNYKHFENCKRPCFGKTLLPLSPEKEYRKGILKRSCSTENDMGPLRSKVPPKVPPKPKKDGPLFEDEGEDGTEV